MGSLATAAAVIFLWWSSTVSAGSPAIRIHRGYISVQDAIFSSGMNSAYTVGQPYTFELYMEDTRSQDYIIDQCTMNGAQFIGSYGCVQCSGTVLQSVETEQYTRAGAIKRTLVHFNAPDPNIHFVCQVRVLDCCGCAERSCERRPPLLGIITHAIPITCGIIAPVVGVYTQPVAYIPPVHHRDAYAVGGGFVAGRTWLAGLPWWVWILLLLLLLLLLLCCLACLLWTCLRGMRRRKQKIVTTRIATIDENKAVGIQVGTDTVVTEKAVGTGGSLYKETMIQEKEKTERIIPAVATDDGYHSHHRETRGASRDTERINESFEATYTRRDRPDGGERYDTYGRDAAGAYSVREGRVVNERFHRGYVPQPSPPDRSSYRNYAYERDMGRVAPMSGFDEVETLERQYCLSDDESELVEKDIKRTHTTRFVQETRTVHDDEQSDNASERYREEGEQHVVYAPQYRV